MLHCWGASHGSSLLPDEIKRYRQSYKSSFCLQHILSFTKYLKYLYLTIHACNHRLGVICACNLVHVLRICFPLGLLNSFLSLGCKFQSSKLMIAYTTLLQISSYNICNIYYNYLFNSKVIVQNSRLQISVRYILCE